MPGLAPIIGAIASAVSAGVGVKEAFFSHPSAPKPAGPPQAQLDQAKQAVASTGSDIVSQTGGSVSPAYTLNLAQLLSGTGDIPGVSGTAQGAINNLFGLGGGPTTAGVSSLTAPGAGGTPGANVSGFQPSGLNPNSANPSYTDEGLSNLFSQVVG